MFGGSLTILVRQSEVSIEDALGTLRTVLLYAGTIAFAVSAALLAGHRRMRIFGVLVFAVIVATGGGTIRDILLGDLPVYWVKEPVALIVAALAAAATMPLVTTGAMAQVERFDLVRLLDAVGLALFTVIGVNVALDAGAGAVSAVVIGLISGAGGGIMRDTIAGRLPEVLSSGHLYASVAIVGAALNVALQETSLSAPVASAIAVTSIFVLRILSLYLGWAAPRFTVEKDDDGGDVAPPSSG